jgi:fucokinase
VCLPVRINFGGGWSDTPPYCLENGGTVLNAAVTLDGDYPIEVEVKRLAENKIVLASTDNGSYRAFTELPALQSCHDPADPFALHKAALIACGIIPEKGAASLASITERLGGGIYLSTCVRNIPRGSGLGTSSILAGACVKGIYEFLGLEADEATLYERVMCLEQIMSTGGGWQDQVGGLIPGIKMVSTAAGIAQKIAATPLSLSEKTLEALNRRFAVIYTGQRRLARNLLREVVSKYIGANEETVDALYEIQRTAVLMRFELEKGNLDGFAKLLNVHWTLSQKIDRSCTNTCIDQIFGSIDDLIDGKMICGAGGGGFLQVLMKEGVTLEDLRARLDEVFAESGVEVRSCRFVL